MLDIFNTILGLAKSLLGVSDQLRMADRQRRRDMAELFEKISSCLAAVSSEIRAGRIPHGRCSELLHYAEALPDHVRQEIGEQRADELGDTLHSSYNVEQAAMELQTVNDSSERESYLQEVEEASGKFQALASLVRAG